MSNTKTTVLLCMLALAIAAVSESDFREAVAMEAERKEFQAWVDQNCIPRQPNERAVSEMRPDGSLQCAMYENAGYASAPKLVFAEVWK